MREFKQAFDNADKEKQAEILKAVESCVDAGAPVYVLKEKLDEFRSQQYAEAC